MTNEGDVITIVFPAWVVWWLLVCCVLGLIHSGLQLYNTYLRGKIAKKKVTPQHAKSRMATTLNADQTVAVDAAYHWQPMSTCPRGVKVQLLGKGGVAVYGTYHGDPFWVGWAPLPKRAPPSATSP